MRRRDTEFTKPQPNIVYGPVESRRLGASIGLNLFPGPTKVCTLSCSYCFIRESSTFPPPTSVPTPDDVIDALTSYFSANKRSIERALYLTFSGNGEPTCHPHFVEIVHRVIDWRRDHKPGLDLAIFTNGTCLSDPNVFNALLLFDKIFLKFDWGCQRDVDVLSHPKIKFDYLEFVNLAKSFAHTIKESDPRHVFILQTAIVPDQKSGVSWHLWADNVAAIAPDEVQLYELDFPNDTFDPPSHFDFLEFQRMIFELMSKKPVPVRFFCKSSYYVKVNLCYAVDSIIYLPLYVADFASVFEQKGVKVTHFVSNDGDLGALNEILRGNAQFALCDPQVVIDFLSSEEASQAGEHSPVLVAVLIDKLALWLVSGSPANGTPREILGEVEQVISYPAGSTANHLCLWQKERAGSPLSVKPVQPGEELRTLCNDPNLKTAAITADLVGAQICTHCRDKHLSLTSYVGRQQLKRFAFTGLLASKDIVQKYPGAVDAVVEGLRKSIQLLNSNEFMDREKEALRKHLQDLYTSRHPGYLLKCPKSNCGLPAAIEKAIDLLTNAHIYSDSGKLHFCPLFNALIIRRASGLKRTPSIRALRHWVDRRAASLPLRLLTSGACLLARFTSIKPTKLILLSIALIVASIACGVAAYFTVAGKQGTLIAFTGIFGSLAGTAVWSLGWNINHNRKPEL